MDFHICDGSEEAILVENTCRLYGNDKIQGAVLNKNNMKLYYTHHNYRRIYSVMIIDDKYVTVNRQNHIKDPLIRIRPQELEMYKNINSFEESFIIGASPNKIWIGKSPKTPTTEFSAGYGPEFDGNTVLLENNKECIFVGHIVFSFNVRHNIVKYVSELGNNDVPYPYAVDEEGYYYLLSDNVVLKVPEEQKNDPYEYYRSHKSTAEPIEVSIMSAPFGREPMIQGHVTVRNRFTKEYI